MNYVNRKGLSLVEAVMSTLVLVLIMAAFFGLHIFARDALSLAHHKIIAMYWAQAQIEAQQADLITRIALDDPSNTTFLSVINPKGKGGLRTEEIDNFMGAGSGLQQVAVQITWVE